MIFIAAADLFCLQPKGIQATAIAADIHSPMGHGGRTHETGLLIRVTEERAPISGRNGQEIGRLSHDDYPRDLRDGPQYWPIVQAMTPHEGTSRGVQRTYRALTTAPLVGRVPASHIEMGSIPGTGGYTVDAP